MHTSIAYIEHQFPKQSSDGRFFHTVSCCVAVQLVIIVSVDFQNSDGLIFKRTLILHIILGDLAD